MCAFDTNVSLNTEFLDLRLCDELMVRESVFNNCENRASDCSIN